MEYLEKLHNYFKLDEACKLVERRDKIANFISQKLLDYDRDRPETYEIVNDKQDNKVRDWFNNLESSNSDTME